MTYLQYCAIVRPCLILYSISSVTNKQNMFTGCSLSESLILPLLLAKSALSFWMYPTAQTTLSPTHSYPWVPPACWFTVKLSKARLQTSSHPQNSASHLIGLQDPQQTPTKNIIGSRQPCVKGIYYQCKFAVQAIICLYLGLIDK